MKMLLPPVLQLHGVSGGCWALGMGFWSEQVTLGSGDGVFGVSRGCWALGMGFSSFLQDAWSLA